MGLEKNLRGNVIGNPAVNKPLTLDHVREVTYWWMIDYTEERPHDALGDMTPSEARQQSVGNSIYELSS